MESLRHRPLEGRRSIGEAERHDQELESPLLRDKPSLLDGVLIHLGLPETRRRL